MTCSSDFLYINIFSVSGEMTTTSRQGQSHSGHPGQNSYDYRYEFSETRKVLEEFFKAENEFPASSQHQSATVYNDSIHTVNQFRPSNHVQSQDTRVNSLVQSQETRVNSHVQHPETDLDYSLTRLETRQPGSSYIGSRLADATDDIVPVISKHVSPTCTPQQSSNVISSPVSTSNQSQLYSRDLLDLCGGSTGVNSVKTSQSRGILTDSFPVPPRVHHTVDPMSAISRIGTADLR